MRRLLPARRARSPRAHSLRTPGVSRREARATASGPPVPETLPAPSGRRIRTCRPRSGRRECRRAWLRVPTDSRVRRAAQRLARFRHTRRGPPQALRTPAAAFPAIRLGFSRIRISNRSSVRPRLPARLRTCRMTQFLPIPVCRPQSRVRHDSPLRPRPVPPWVRPAALRPCVRSAAPPPAAQCLTAGSPVRRAGRGSRRIPACERPPSPVVADPAMSPGRAQLTVRPPVHAQPSRPVLPALRRHPVSGPDTIAG